MKLLTTLFLLGISAALQAQIAFEKLESGSGSPLNDINYIMNPKYTNGNPLGFEEWRRGRVVVESGDTSEYFMINYHTLGDVVYFKDLNSGLLYMTDETKIERLLIQDAEAKERVFERIEWQSFIEFPEYSRYCEVLLRAEGFDLLKYFDKELEDPDDADIKRVVRFDTFLPNIRYFWRAGADYKYEEVSFNRNWLKEVLSEEQQEKIKEYQKKNKMRWSREDEVLEMLSKIL